MVKNKKIIYWIRHGESLSNISDLNHNIIDPDLTTNGKKQCQELKKKIKLDNIDYKIDLVVVSPLTRTLETCSNTFDDLINKTKFICLEEIREHIDKPCHKRKKKNILVNKYKQIDFSNLEYDDDFLYNKYNGLETKTQVIDRCNKFIRWLKSRKEKNIAVITHGNFLYPMFNDVLKDISNKTFFSNCELRIYESV
jgi:broad specificity phosphatase PhoE